MDDIVASLNQQQKQAVTFGEGPLLVLAGAGSGKTKALTHRAAWLIKQQLIPAHQILLLTFTNKAAAEMQERVMNLVGSADIPFAGTFHRFCAKVLRQHGHRIGISNDYVIFDGDDQETAIKQVLLKIGLDVKKYKPSGVLATISNAKSELISPANYQNLANNTWQENIGIIYQHYQELLDQAQALDFDDLLYKTVELFRDQQDIATSYQQQYQHVLIDEYQDTNAAQYQLFKLLTILNRNFMAVGDFSQSIYSWRGADFRNLNHLERDYPDLTIIRLEQNYRSTQNILKAAYSIISHNRQHPILELWSDAGDGELIHLHQAYDENDEARFISDKINQHILSGKAGYGDFAVLYRTNAQSRSIEEALLHAAIPYTLVGGVRFYARTEIKDLLAYLRLVTNPHDPLAYDRALKIGKRRLSKFESWAPTVRTDVSEEKLDTLSLLDQIIETTGYLDRFNPDDSEDLGRLENIQELRSVAARFPKLLDFLENVALVEQETLRDASHQQDKVTLMTLHTAKGLEFTHVFLVGLEEGLFPHSRSLTDPQALEEERRLCYVGITRAKQQLYLSFAAQRYYFGRRESFVASRFITEIPKDLISFPDQLSSRKSFRFSDEIDDFLDLPFSGVNNDDW